MRAYITNNVQFLLLMLLWVITGAYLGYAIYAVLPATVLLFKKREMYAELLISFFFILILSDSYQPGLAFAQDIKNLFIVLLALFFLSDRESFRPVSTIYARFIPFFIIAALCLLFSDVFFPAFQKTLSYFLVLLVVTNLVLKLVREDPEGFFIKLFYFIVLLLIIGILLKYLRPSIVTLEGRYTGVLGNPNGLGVFCFLFFLVYAVVIHFRPGLLSRGEKLVILGAIFTSIILSGSRSAIVSVFIFLFFSYFYRMSSFLGLIIFFLVILSYQYITSNLVNIVIYLGLQDYFRLDTLDDASGRLVAWSFAWKKIQDNMFIGKGFYYTERLFKENYAMLSQEGHQGNAHNSYLTFWLDTGLVGLVCYVFAFLSSFIRAARESYLAVPIFYAIVFSANFESWLTGSLNPLTIQVWILLTLLLSMRKVNQNESMEANPAPEKDAA